MGKSVLAGDDSRSMRQMVTFTLKGTQYEVVEAVDGQDGLEKSKSNHFDLILTDQNMPKIEMVFRIL